MISGRAFVLAHTLRLCLPGFTALPAWVISTDVKLKSCKVICLIFIRRVIQGRGSLGAGGGGREELSKEKEEKVVCGSFFFF